MRTNINMIFVIASIATSSTAQAVSFHPTDADRGAGDFLQIALPAVGLGMTLFKGVDILLADARGFLLQDGNVLPHR